MLSHIEQSLFLQSLPGVGNLRLSKLVTHFSSFEKLLTSDQLLHKLPEPAVKQIDALGRYGSNAHCIQAIRGTIEWALTNHIHIIDWRSKHYPELLSQTVGFPLVLYVKGDIDCLSMPQIAIVGSRSCSHVGRRTAMSFARELSRGGFAITSGLALGIDAAAHKGAMDSGKTIAVMGSGIDIVYPRQNQDLSEAIVESGGAIVSEFPLGTSPHPANFPQRNRIISGLSCGTLVIEAALKSGSLITARCAAEQNREIFAVPGSVNSPLSKGCHQLIRDGAKLVDRAEEIVEELSGVLSFQRDLIRHAETQPAAQSKNPLIKFLEHDASTVDDIVERSGMAAADVLANLVELELEGVIVCEGNGYLLAS